VVGVLRPGARLPPDVPGARVPSAADVYLPLEYGPAFNAASRTDRNSNYLAVLAVARQGVGPEDVNRDLHRIAGELKAAFPQAMGTLGMDAIQARELVVGDVRRPLLMLSFAVGFVLLVACANVANLMLTRASARKEELAVRTALGARRSRLLRQLLTEAVVLALTGGALGLVLAHVGTEALVAARPADIPRLDEIRLDWTVAAFAMVISLVAGLGFGALPALQATTRFSEALRAGRRGGGADRRSHRLRAGLVVTEVALAVVLLAGAGLMLRTLAALTRVAPGFSTENAISFRTAFFGSGYDPKTVLMRAGEIEAALRALPGATAAAATTVLPLSGPGPRLAFSVIGAPPPPPNVNPEIGVAAVTPGYLPAVGATLMKGRHFTAHDDGSQALVAMVNESAVRRWFPDGSPIGKHVQMSGDREVIGVVADMQQGDPKQAPAPQLFVPYAQRPARSLWFVVRSAVDPATLASSVRTAVRRADPNLAVSEVRVFTRLQAEAIARPRFYTALLSLFAGVALVLSVIGIFGIMSQTVVERTREIGIRIALGARSADVLRLIIGRAVLLALAGVVIGLAGALAASQAIRSQLFGIDVLDLPTLGGVVVILVAAVAAASFLPALRAARLDPGSTLRQG
jgi:putative ABC transport system permease protein